MIGFRQLKDGYTIVEVMIVLVISSALFIVAVSGYSQQNRKTEFVQAIRDVELGLQDVLNDVSTGYYPSSGNFTCTRAGGSPASPSVSGGSGGQGTNQDCIFVGRALDILSTSGDSTYEIYTVIGLRNDSSDVTKSATNVENTENRAITVAGNVEQKTTHGSINITKVLIGDGSSNAESDGFAVISGFGGGAALGGSSATSSQVSIASINDPHNFASDSIRVVSSSANLNQTITLCIEERGGGAGVRHATITIGSASQVNINTQIDYWPSGCS